MTTIAEATGQVAPERELAPQHREYREAWQVLAERAAVVRAMTGVDPLDGLAPAWHADRTTLARTDRAAGKADSGPRRAHGSDDTVALTHAARAEMTDGLALSLALIGTMYGGIPSTAKCAGLRALNAIDRTESAWASTVTLMGHETTPAVDGLAGAYRWVPECAELTDGGRMVAYGSGHALATDRGGRGGREWVRFARRHGWNVTASKRADAEDAGVSRQALDRAEKGLTEALEMVGTDGFPTEAPGRGRPAAWTLAATWLREAGVIDAEVLPGWLAARPAPADAAAPQYRLAWERMVG